MAHTLGCQIGGGGRGLIIGWKWDFRENPPKNHKKAPKSTKSANGPHPVYLAAQSIRVACRGKYARARSSSWFYFYSAVFYFNNDLDSCFQDGKSSCLHCSDFAEHY